MITCSHVSCHLYKACLVCKSPLLLEYPVTLLPCCAVVRAECCLHGNSKRTPADIHAVFYFSSLLSVAVVCCTRLTLSLCVKNLHNPVKLIINLYIALEQEFRACVSRQAA